MASESNYFDTSFLPDIGISNLHIFYNFATHSLDRIQRKFAAIDSKASQTISLLAVVSGVLVFALSSSNIKNDEVKLILYGSIICFIIATLCCLWCLRVRSVLEPQTVEGAIKWLKEKDIKNIEVEILSALIIDIANAEKSYIDVYDKKTKYLSIGQDFEVIGIMLLFIFIVVSITYAVN